MAETQSISDLMSQPLAAARSRASLILQILDGFAVAKTKLL